MIVSVDKAGVDSGGIDRPNRMTAGRGLALIILCLVFCSCSQHQPTRPVLASFDRLKAPFEQIDVVSHEVAVDVQTLNRSMQANNVAESRRRADLLAIHAARLSTKVTHGARTVRSLLSHEGNRTVRTYFRMLLGVLAHQSAEGRALQQLAHLTWSDPLITSTPDEQRLSRLVGAARRNAQQAVRLAGRASAWRSRHKKEFRYSVPQHTT